MASTHTGKLPPRLALIQARINALFHDPSTSYWMARALRSALERDPVDALRDAEALVELLKERADAILEMAQVGP